MAAIDRYINSVVERAVDEAHEDGSAAVEAHHLLLGIAAEPDTVPQQLLAAAGLGRAQIRAALDKEFEQSLNAVGVSAAAFGPLRRTRTATRPKMGASAKLAFERGFTLVDRKKDLRPAHLLLGILKAAVGTVPRALTAAGIDQADLVTRVERSLAIPA